MVYEVTAGKVLKQDFFPFSKDLDYKRQITYIFNVPTMARAQIYQSIFPYQNDPSQGCGSLGLKTKSDVISLAVDGRMGMYNNGICPLFLVHDGKLVELTVNTPVFIDTWQRLDDMSLRSTKIPQNISYRDLTYEERERYLPLVIANRKESTLNYTTIINEWVLATEYVYKGTLTYVATRDKEMHFIDEQQRKYKYNIDNFRQLVPFLFKGTLSGSFRYSPRGNRQVKYILVPHLMGSDDDDGDIIVCDSDSSGSESEDNSLE